MDSSSVCRLEMPTTGTAQQKTSGVNVAPMNEASPPYDTPKIAILSFCAIPSSTAQSTMSIRSSCILRACCFSLAATKALPNRSEEHTSELQSHVNLVCRLLLEKKKKYFF